MEFFRGLLGVAFLYTFMWLIYHTGYIHGVEGERYETRQKLESANGKLQRCNDVIAHNRQTQE